MEYIAPLSEDEQKSQALTGTTAGGAEVPWTAEQTRAFNPDSYPTTSMWGTKAAKNPYPVFSGAFQLAVQGPVAAQRKADLGALTAGLLYVSTMTSPFPASQASNYLAAMKDAFSEARMPTLPAGVRSYVYNDLEWDLTRGLFIQVSPVSAHVGPLPAWLSGVEGEAACKTWDSASAAMKEPMATLIDVTRRRAASVVAAAQAEADSANAMLRLAKAVATLGMSELLPILQEKWRLFKKAFADYDATASEIERRLADPQYTEASKTAVRAQYEAQKGGVMNALSGHGDFTFAGVSMPLPDINAWLNDPSEPTLDGLGSLGFAALLGSLSTPVLIAAIVAITVLVIAALIAIKPLLDALAKAVSNVADALGGTGLLLVLAAAGGFWAYKKGWLKKLGIGK